MDRVAVFIRYHVYWPSPNDPYYVFNPTENRARNTYYGNNYTPHFFIDGSIDGEYYNNQWQNMITARAEVSSPLIMEIGGSYDENNRSGNMTVTISAEETPSQSNLKLRVALIENGIRWNAPNGSTAHEQTFRDMIPSTAGEPVTISAHETLEFSYDFTTPSPLVPANCVLVAFVQSDQNKEILQGARSWVSRLTPTEVEDGAPMPNEFSLEQNYPNPFNADTRIGFITDGGAAELMVYDLTGSLVKNLFSDTPEAGYHSVIWDGTDESGNDAASGVYFYRLKTNGEEQIKRMTLLK